MLVLFGIIIGTAVARTSRTTVQCPSVMMLQKLIPYNLVLKIDWYWYDDDCVLQTIFCSKSDAIKTVWTAFENYFVTCVFTL